MKRRNFIKSVIDGVTTLFFGEKLVAKSPDKDIPGILHRYRTGQALPISRPKPYRQLLTIVEHPESCGHLTCEGSPKFCCWTHGWFSSDKKPTSELSGEFNPQLKYGSKENEKFDNLDFIPNIFVARPIPNKEGWYSFYAARYEELSKF